MIPNQREGEDFRTPSQREGEDFRTAVKREGEDFRTPIKREGEDFRTPAQGEGEDFREAVKREGEDFRTAVKREGEDFRRAVAGTGDGTQILELDVKLPASRIEVRRSPFLPAALREKNTPLRLVHIGPCFMNGGVEQHALSLAKFFDPQRVLFQKCLVTNSELISPQAVAAMPVPVEYCPLDEIHDRTAEFDIALLWGDGYNDCFQKSRPPLCVFVAHGESWWTAEILQNSDRVIDHAIAVSARAKESVCRGIPTTTVLNGADTGHLGQSRPRAEVRERLGFAPHDFVLGSVGRFSEEKRMPLLIEAVSQLPKHFKLLLVGHGARYHELVDLANRLIPGRYAFATAADYLGDYYRAMDAFSLVSAHEGFGLVIAEALHCERPVIVTNVGCVPEIIRDKINGLVVAPTPAAIAEAARLLHDHPAWAKGIAAEGRAVAESKLHAARMAREYEELFWQLWRSEQRVGVGDLR